MNRLLQVITGPIKAFVVSVRARAAARLKAWVISMCERAVRVLDRFTV